jgi:hypothetical protein
VFCWVKLDGNLLPADESLKVQIQNGLKILLARAKVFNCQLRQPLSIAQRRNARPAKQPYIACGKTSESETDWQLWPNDAEPGRGLQVKVDTSAARFGLEPCYSAHIIGKRVFSAQIVGGPTTSFLLDGFINVSEPSPTGFTLQVLMPVTNIGNLPLNPPSFWAIESFKAMLQNNGWHVAWMGVEG